jgi:hypothetical protein
VLVPVRGGTETFIAYADEAVALASEVLVISSRGYRSVDVVPWSMHDDLSSFTSG